MLVQVNIVVKVVASWHKELSYTADKYFFSPFSDLEEELLEEDWLSGKKVMKSSITSC